MLARTSGHPTSSLPIIIIINRCTRAVERCFGARADISASLMASVRCAEATAQRETRAGNGTMKMTAPSNLGKSCLVFSALSLGRFPEISCYEGSIISLRPFLLTFSFCLLVCSVGHLYLTTHRVPAARLCTPTDIFRINNLNSSYPLTAGDFAPVFIYLLLPRTTTTKTTPYCSNAIHQCQNH